MSGFLSARGRFLCLAILALASVACGPQLPEASEGVIDMAPWNSAPLAALSRKPAAGVLERVEAFQIASASGGGVWVSATRFYAYAADGSACAIGANEALMVRIAADSAPELITCRWGSIGPAFHRMPPDSVSPFPDK